MLRFVGDDQLITVGTLLDNLAIWYGEAECKLVRAGSKSSGDRASTKQPARKLACRVSVMRVAVDPTRNARPALRIAASPIQKPVSSPSW